MSIDANQLEKLVIDYNKSIRDIGDEKNGMMDGSMT